MNIFKKIAAVMCAAAVMAAAALTASAEEGQSFGKAMSAKLDENDNGFILTLENVPSQYAECDSLYADIQFTTLTRENGEYVMPGFNRYSVRARKDKDVVIGAYVVYDSQTGEWQGGNAGGSGMVGFAKDTFNLLLAFDAGNKYFDDSFTDFNAVYVEIYGSIGNERVNYTQSGELTQERQVALYIVREVTDVTDTSHPETTSSDISSEPTSSDTSSEPTSFDTSSEPTSSDTSSEPTSSDTSSEPTSSDTSSEPTSSETSTEPASSENPGSTSGGNDNPDSGAVMLLIPLAIIGGASAAVAAKKRK